MKHLVSKLLVVVYLLPTLSLAQGTDPDIKRVEQGLLPQVLLKGDPGWSIAERMKFYKVPGLSVAVIKDFKIDWARAYGVKDLTTNEPVTTDTLFQAGSISKSVNAAVAMKEVEQGKISLDENINDKLTSWKLPDNEFTANKKVTLRALLSHSAGTTVHGFPGYAVNEKVPSLQQVLDGTAPANTAPVRVDFQPGSQFRYSGGGITITQLAIMDIEKKPYPEIAREAVLAPLNMSHSTYNQPLPDDWRKKAATGYRADGREVEGKIHVYPEMAAAGLWTTPSDLAKFGIELQRTLAGKSNKVLQKQSVELMTTGVLQDVGLGFFIENHGSAKYFGHDGADEGFRAAMLLSREKGNGVVVMANSDNGQILGEVVRGVAAVYGWDQFLPTPYTIIPFDRTKLNEYTGRFQANQDSVLTLTNQNGTLVAEPTGEPKFELLPISETTFIRRDADLKYEFVRSSPAGGSSQGDGFLPVDSIKLLTPKGSNGLRRISSQTLVPLELMLAGKISEALTGYRQIKQDKTDAAAVSEGRINNLGYTMLQQKKLPEAIALFKLNVEFYPKAWNTYDSLGEAYMNSGNKDLAIANYRKSLELNPQNANGREMLKKLEGK